MAKKMNNQAKAAKKAADAIINYVDNEGEHDHHELKIMMDAFNFFTKVVAENGGPAWNASEEQWEY